MPLAFFQIRGILPCMSIGRIPPILRKKSHSRKTKKRLAVKSAMLAAHAAKNHRRQRRG